MLSTVIVIGHEGPQHWEDVRLLVLRSAHIYPMERPGTKLSGPQGQFGHEEKSPPLPPLEIKPGPLQPVDKRTVQLICIQSNSACIHGH